MSPVPAAATRGAPPFHEPTRALDGQTGRVAPALSIEPVVGALAELVRSVERSGARVIDGDRHRPRLPAEAPVEGARSADPPAPAIDDALADAIPPELEALIAESNGDPLLLLTLLDAAFQTSRLEGNVRSVGSAQRTSEQAAIDRERAIDRAIRRAGQGRRLPKWLKKMLKAIAIAASIVASAFTGGALAAVAIAGAVLMLAAPHVGKFAVALGMDSEKAKWLVLSLQIVGGAMSVGTGGAGAAAGAQAAQIAERAAELTSRIVGATSQVLEGSEQVAQSVFRFQAAAAQNAADAGDIRFDAASLGLEEAVDVLRDGMRSLERSLESRVELLSLRAAATQAILRRAL